MPNSAEKRESPIVVAIMLIAIFTSLVGLMWCLKKGIEESFPPKIKTEIKK